jgi:hypothetical protein
MRSQFALTQKHVEIHICWNVDKELRMDPPIHVLLLIWGGWGGRGAKISQTEVAEPLDQPVRKSVKKANAHNL